LDTVFADRNKAYGAYQLRQLAPRATNTAMGIVLVAVLGICGIAYARSNNAIVSTQVKPVDDVYSVTLVDEEIVEMETPIAPPEPMEAEQPQQVAQDVPAQDVIKFTEIKATDISNVNEDMVATDEVLDKKKLPGNITMEGVKGGELIPKGTFGKTKREGGERGVREGSLVGTPEGSNDPFTSVEIMPEPVGGMKAFVQWVADNYDFPQGAIDGGAKGVIQVSFVVEKDGSLSSFEVVRDMGYSTGAAAINLLKKAKKWNPGIQNGRPVRVAFTLPIRLQVTN
jgi:protein TonB